MFNFREKKLEEERELQKLIIAIKKVEKPELNYAQKSAAKGRILQDIELRKDSDFIPFSLCALKKKIRSIGNNVVLPARLVCALKEKIMDVVERTPSVIGASPYARYSRAAVSVVLLVVFTATALFTMPFRVPVAYAGTYLDEVEGEVLVWRDGRIMKAKPDLSILEGDVVLTKEKSTVTVHFLDDSVSRLGENTGLEIRKLYSDPLHPIVSRVELYLQGGRIWTRVKNLIDDESAFKVGTLRAVADVPKKAAFDLSAMENSTRVAVFDNMVDLLPANASLDTPVKTVIAGYQAEITDGSVGGIEVKRLEADDPEVKSSKKWLALNLAKDEDYDQSLSDTAAEAVLNETGGEDAGKTVVFSSPDVENEKLYFLDHYSELIKAETMFMRGNHKEGSKLLRSFRKGIKNILDRLQVLRGSDPDNVDLLKSLMQEKINLQLKDMSNFLPGDKLYPVKEALGEVALLLTDGEVSKTQLRMSQAEQKLLEIQELLKDDNINYAAVLLNDYREKTEQVILKLDSENAGEFENKLVELITQQVQQIEVLMTIEELLADGSHADFLAEIKVFRQESLVKLLDTLEKLKGQVPAEVLLELKDVFDTYLADESDRDIMAPVFENLFNRDGVLNFIQPDSTNIPDEVGVVMILNMEATPDAQVSDPAVGQQSQN